MITKGNQNIIANRKIETYMKSWGKKFDKKQFASAGIHDTNSFSSVKRM